MLRRVPFLRRPDVADARAAVAGAVAAALALGVGELLGGLVEEAPSLIVAIGGVVIDLQPAGAKDFAVALFGEADKLALEVLIAGVAIAVGGALGILGRRQLWLAQLGFLLFGVVGLVAAAQDPLVSLTLALLTTGAAVAVGIIALPTLLQVARGTASRTDTHASPDAGSGGATEQPGRRRFLITSGGVALAAFGAVVAGRSLSGQVRAVEARPGGLPSAAEPAASPGAGSTFDIAGLTPLVVPNEEFYRIDTNLIVPRLDTEGWSLRVHGMVDREVTLSYEELLAMPLVERFVTIACVSNEVGGDLVGNARWTGVPLQDVLDMAGVQEGATQIVGRAFDGWTAGFPTAHGGPDGREGIIAIAMNGEPLPPAHGYPARLIIPGLFGYVSATKWLAEIELTTLEAFDAYWVPLGWAKEGPILTQSRIDVPRPGSRVAGGTVTFAGVAWAPDRGVSAVELSIDEGEWLPAEISRPISEDTWVQWRRDWASTPGDHTIRARATDGSGAVQEERITRPAPDGARGYHTVRLMVG
ncbi:MAG: molybdopterin-dependent oxidoreductase [Chloroflexi bacterium]|nr:molybdopterin-dependent oxidoreductase [Chloroflexota bacterium]